MSVETVFYDGECGFCHRSVQFILARDPDGKAFRFAPLQGETFDRLVGPEARDGLPDSLIVRRDDGTLLVQSTATLHILSRLGGGWAILSAAGSIVPRALRDVLYAGFARIRHRLFAKPVDACPLLPPALRARFDP
ncbi:MAG: DCC1-like thiol-disulfide oxidoreductase family protein [Myxococcota bacterium]|nr:DCC1-like thiol-disulfide oxidoreductase family protein [Myxococcota bacterium]